MTIRGAGAGGMLMLSSLFLSCSGGSTGPTSGILNVQFSSLRADDGAVLFTIAGGPVESLEPVSGTLDSASIDPNTLRVVVIGNLSSGTIARVRIPDVSLASHYSVAVNQVASRSTYELRDPTPYSITFRQ